ncbi:unnamed protein product [Caretta caretta]
MSLPLHSLDFNQSPANPSPWILAARWGSCLTREQSPLSLPVSMANDQHWQFQGKTQKAVNDYYLLTGALYGTVTDLEIENWTG